MYQGSRLGALDTLTISTVPAPTFRRLEASPAGNESTVPGTTAGSATPAALPRDCVRVPAVVRMTTASPDELGHRISPSLSRRSVVASMYLLVAARTIVACDNSAADGSNRASP